MAGGIRVWVKSFSAVHFSSVETGDHIPAEAKKRVNAGGRAILQRGSDNP